MNQECITNRMIKRLEELKKEKETLAMEVEREEEMMSNTLQRKLTQVYCITLLPLQGLLLA
jgi:coiled-coil domain-containing protein 6